MAFGLKRRTVVVLLFAASSAAAGVLGFACGFDGRGEGPVPVEDTGIDVQVEANLPPGNDAATDAPIDAPPPGCPTTGVKGPALVLVSFDGGASTCIDESEVTNEQYGEFLGATGDGGDPSSIDGGVPAACAPFTTFHPVAPVPSDAGAPIQGVTWCQAYAYCKWAGKRLCTAEWRRVCSREGTRSFPYGTTVDPTACNVGDAGGATESVVKSFPKCVGGYPGIYDMVGNVSEWIDECSGGNCGSVGGSYITTRADAATCSTTDIYQPKVSFASLGFRCCR